MSKPVDTITGFFLGVLATTQFVQNAKTQLENNKTLGRTIFRTLTFY